LSVDRSKPSNGAHGTRIGSLSGYDVKKRVAAYEALQRDTKGNPERSFLPTLGTSSEPSPNGASPVKANRFNVPNSQNPAQILPKQREVADQMAAGPRNVRQTHQVVGSLASINSGNVSSLTSPPVPPRAPRAARQADLPILVLAHDIHQPLMTQPSSPDSAKVLGSDILRSREHVVGALTTPHRRSNGDSEQAEAGGGTPERERGTSRSSLSIHSVITGAGGSQHPRPGEIIWPTTSTTFQSAQTQGDAESFAIVHQGLPSTAWSSREVSSSTAAIDALKRPTFGEGSFDRFKGEISASKGILSSPHDRDAELLPSPETQSAPEE